MEPLPPFAVNRNRAIIIENTALDTEIAEREHSYERH
jgi:hypothetical protein